MKCAAYFSEKRKVFSIRTPLGYMTSSTATRSLSRNAELFALFDFAIMSRVFNDVEILLLMAEKQSKFEHDIKV